MCFKCNGLQSFKQHTKYHIIFYIQYLPNNLDQLVRHRGDKSSYSIVAPVYEIWMQYSIT